MSPLSRKELSRIASPGFRRVAASADARQVLPPSPALLSHPLPATPSRRLRSAHTAACASRSTLVVSHHLDGFLCEEVAGLLHPAASHGVTCVSRASFRWALSRSGVDDPFPVGRFTPRSLPSRAAVPPSPGPFPPCRSYSESLCIRFAPLPARIESTRFPDHVDFEVLLRSRVRSACHRFQWTRRPVLPWACFPFEVLHLFRRSIEPSRERSLSRAGAVTVHARDASSGRETTRAIARRRRAVTSHVPSTPPSRV